MKPPHRHVDSANFECAAQCNSGGMWHPIPAQDPALTATKGGLVVEKALLFQIKRLNFIANCSRLRQRVIRFRDELNNVESQPIFRARV